VFTPFLALLFAFQVLVVVSFGFVVWFWLLKIYPASDVASFGFLAPVFGLFFAWAILGEHIGANLLVALCFIAAGIALVNRRNSA
jgi:drug/metabolite transporter (DMT)-like permease